MSLYQFEIAGCVTDEAYEEAIPACCAYQSLDDHVYGLMLCWSLVSAIEKGCQVNCGGCDCAKTAL